MDKTRRAFWVLCWTVAALSVAVPANAQVEDTAWVRLYNGPGDTTDFATTLKLDSAGNVYVLGTTFDSGTGYDFTILKYDPDGALLWERRYNGPGNGPDTAADMQLDAAGNVYVTGASWGTGTNLDFATLKYDAVGNLLWVRRYNAGANLADRANAVQVDAAGNVYVTGQGQGLGTGQDYITLKYDASGNLLWSRIYNGDGNGNDSAGVVRVDPVGNVYVTGTSWGLGTAYDFATVKYNAAGILQWARRYNGTGNINDQGKDLRVDAAGNVYVTGASWGNGTRDDYVTIKYDAAGNLLWEQRYDGPGGLYDRPGVLKLDGLGHLYITGGSDGIKGYSLDFATLKYDTDGNLLWERRFNGVGNGIDVARDLLIDPAGFVYVAGTSNAHLADYTVVKYSSTGDQLYTLLYTGPDNAVESLAGFAVDTAGGIHLTGTTTPTSETSDIATVKFLACSCRDRSDGDGDGMITAVDVGMLVDIVFFGGPDLKYPLCPTTRFDFDCDGSTTAVDLSGLVDYVFFGAAAGPCDVCAP